MFWSVTVYDIDTRSQMRIYLGDRAASSLKPSTRCPRRYRKKPASAAMTWRLL
ncbi:hypothetical protein [Bradyrhizobium sp. RDI18]|uniref:hypothetical protein n=1 Tax=Bradyrhizobium sp. RDI18 TaxID=3367400 RepID=UPI00370FD638